MSDQQPAIQQTSCPTTGYLFGPRVHRLLNWPPWRRSTKTTRMQTVTMSWLQTMKMMTIMGPIRLIAAIMATMVRARRKIILRHRWQRGPRRRGPLTAHQAKECPRLLDRATRGVACTTGHYPQIPSFTTQRSYCSLNVPRNSHPLSHCSGGGQRQALEIQARSRQHMQVDMRRPVGVLICQAPCLDRSCHLEE